MRAVLDAAALRPSSWPAGIHVRTFEPGDAAALHALLAHAYRRGGGSVTSFAAWRAETIPITGGTSPS